jgi:hypothetical protein
MYGIHWKVLRLFFSLKFQYIILILEFVNNNENDNIINNDAKNVQYTTCTNEKDNRDFFSC